MKIIKNENHAILRFCLERSQTFIEYNQTVGDCGRIWKIASFPFFVTIIKFDIFIYYLINHVGRTLEWRTAFMPFSLWPTPQQWCAIIWFISSHSNATNWPYHWRYIKRRIFSLSSIFSAAKCCSTQGIRVIQVIGILASEKNSSVSFK